jgi:phage-related protein
MNEELKVIISAEISKLKKNVNDAKSSITSFKGQVDKAKADVEANFKAIGENIGNSLKTAAAVGATALAGVTTALIGTAAATEEYRKNQGLLASAFEAANGSAETAKNTYNDLYRVLGDNGQATEAAQHLAKLTTNEKELSEWTNICQGIYATFGASLPIEGLTEAANETAKVGTVTGGLADALNWAGVSEDEFNEKLAKCNDEAEREKLIRETLNGIYDNAAQKYEKNNAASLAQNEAQAKLTDTMAKLGEAVAPVVTAFTEFATEALAKVEPYISDLASKYGPELKEALGKVGEIVKEVFTTISDNWEIFVTIGAVIGGIATAIGLYNTVAAIKAAMAAAEVTTVWGLVAAYAAQAAAMIVAIAPYVLIVAAIAAVIAIIVLCVKHWDEIKAKVTEVWNSIKEKVAEAVENVKAKFNEFKEKISNKVTEIKTAVTEKFEEIKATIKEKIETAKEIALAIFEGITGGIKNKIETAKNIIKNVIDVIKGIFTGDFGAAKDAVLRIFDNIKDGIKNKIENAKNTVSTVIDKIKGFFNFEWSLPKIKTPKLSITWSDSPAWMAEAAKLVGLEGVPKFSVNWNALGGVFDKPTLFNYGGSLQGIGENGAEAVVPLENNLMWLDRLANMLNDKLGNRPVILMVDKKVLAETSIEGINNITKQTGSLPLVYG